MNVKFIQFLKHLPISELVLNKIKKVIVYNQSSLRLEEIAFDSDSKPGVSAERLRDGSELIVSLTTHSKRLFSVHKTIESIFQQTVKPQKVVLWIQTNEYNCLEQLPLVLQMQCRRGLQIEFVEDMRSYTKLLPALKKYPDANIITVDDDIIYPRNMIERLVSAHYRNPGSVCALGVRQLEVINGKFKNYNDCRFVVKMQDTTSHFQVAEGFAGVLYPPHCFTDKVFDSSLFLNLAPTTDDLWLWVNEVIAGVPVTAAPCYRRIHEEILSDEDVQDIGLGKKNIINNGNDVQFQALIKHFGIHRLLLK